MGSVVELRVMPWLVLFDEPATGARLLFISVIVFEIVGLRLVSGGH